MNLYQAFQAQNLLETISPGPLIVGVSGGADSVCLLHCVRRLSKGRSWTPVVVHIQHGLRGTQSKRDEDFVKSLAKKWGLAFESREIRPPKKTATEEKSRMLRYTQLGQAARKYNANIVLTAHHANDQAETFLLNLLRGSGPDGLCGMQEFRSLKDITGQPSHKNILVCRPLLSFSKDEIESYLKSQHLRYRVDSSNRSLKYKRNWVRHKVIPLLEKAQPRFVGSISDLTRLLREQKKYIDQEICKMEKSVVCWGGKPAGERLDLTKFFQYNSFLRQYFLHRLRPASSQREIGEIETFLNKRKSAEIVALPR